MRRLALGLLPLLAACFDVVPVTEPAPPPSGPARISLSIEVSPGAGAVSVGVWGVVSPGGDTAAVEGAVGRDPLRVMGRAIYPQRERRDLIPWYADRWEVAEADSVPVALPALPGILSAAPRVAHPPRRVGRDTLVLGEGEDLVLLLEAAPLPPDRGRWSLSLTGVDGSLHVARAGSPPAELRLPRWTLPTARDGLLHVSLDADERLPFDTDPADLLVDVSVRTRLRWVVRVTAGPGTGTP